MSTQNKALDTQIDYSSSQTIEASRRVLAPLIISLVACVAFLPTLLNGFVDWGDQSWINNPNFKGLRGSHIIWMLINFHTGSYQPLNWMTLALDYDLWWNDPFGYHLTSLFVHACNAVLFYFVAMRLYVSAWSNLALTASACRAAAAMAALVFAIHPLRVEPVAWASARGDIVAGLFFLSSVLFYLRATEQQKNEKLQPTWAAASYLSYALSLFSSSIGLALPLVLLCLDIYPLRRLRGDLQSSFELHALRSLVWKKVPYFLIAGVAAAVATVAEHRDDTVSGSLEPGALTSVFHIVARPAFYLWKTVVPLGLSPYYGLQSSALILASLALLAISAGLSVTRRPRLALLTSWICYLVLLIPLPGSDPGGQQLLADRHTYLSCLPWALLIGAAVVRSWHTWASCGAPGRSVFFGSASSALVLIGLGTLTWAQTRVWHDSETLWRNAVAATGSSQAHYNLAVLQEAQGKYDDAIASYNQVAKVDPRRWDAHEKAALLLQRQGKIREAVAHYRQVVQINPDATEARNNLASGLVTLGELREAIQHYRKVLEHAPERNDARVKLGTILTLQGSLSDATDLFQQAVDRDPKDAKTLLKLGQVLAARGALDRAIQYFRQAVQIQPEDAEIHESLGRALLEQGKRDEAAQHLQEAVRILKSSPVSR